MAAIIAAHAGLAALVLLGAAPASPIRPAARLTVIDIAPEQTDAPARPAPVDPRREPRRLAIVPTTVPIDAAPPPGGAGTGNGCAVAAAVGAAVIADAAAMDELAALPPELRSEADAVMLWNGAWLDTAAAPPEAATIPALRRVVTQTVEALPAECRDALTAGPQLIPIPEPGRTTMVVIGSGQWRWSSLLEPADAPGALPGAGDQSLAGWLASLSLSGN